MTTSEPSTRDLTRIVLRPLASSLPIGFFAFSVGTILLTALQLSWVPLLQQRFLLVLTLIVVVPLQLLAAILAYLARDGGAATALAFLAAIWAGISVVSLSGPPGARSPVVAIFLLTVAPMLLGLAVAAFRGKPVFGVLLVVAVTRYTLTGIYQDAGGTVIEHASGWLGIPIALIGLYGGLALLLEDVSGKSVLPLGRIGAARLPDEPGPHLDRATRQAGVRSQL